VVVAGCADATGILVTAKPVDQAVMGADTLRVFVGRETVEVTPAIRAHFDDGRATAYEVDSFTSARDILLSGDGGESEFWIAIRAYDGDVVVGEGGVSHPLQLVAGEVGAITVPIERVESEPSFMPNCPGAGAIGDRDYIVADLDTDDCDLDGDPLAAGDCDDFDPTVNAQSFDRPCVVTDGGLCRLGTMSCTGADATCVPSTTDAPLDGNACLHCEASPDPLLACLRAAIPIASCTIHFTPDAFCVPSGQPQIAASTWYEPAGVQVQGGSATWRLAKPGLDYGWIEDATTFVSQTTSVFPPWPAVKSETTSPLPIDHNDSDTLLVTISTPGGTRVTGLVDFRYQLAGDGGTSCPDDPSPDCTELPAP
jgi:hypothetical protein